MTDLSPATMPAIYQRTNCFPNYGDRYATTERRAITRANAMVDDIAERHGFVLPPTTSARPSAQQVRDRIELLRRAIPDLSNTENARLSRADLRLHEITNPDKRLVGSAGKQLVSTGLGASWEGAPAFAIDDTADRLGELLREQNGGVAGAFTGFFDAQLDADR